MKDFSPMSFDSFTTAEKITIIATLAALLPALDLFLKISFNKTNMFFRHSSGFWPAYLRFKKFIHIRNAFIRSVFFHFGRLSIMYIITIFLFGLIDGIWQNFVFNEVFNLNVIIPICMMVVISLPISFFLEKCNLHYKLYLQRHHASDMLKNAIDGFLFVSAGLLVFISILVYVYLLLFLFTVFSLSAVFVSVFHYYFFGSFLFEQFFDFNSIKWMVWSDEEFILPSILVWNYIAPFQYFLSLFQRELLLMSYGICRDCSYYFVYDAMVYVNEQQMELFAFQGEIESSSSWNPMLPLVYLGHWLAIPRLTYAGRLNGVLMWLRGIGLSVFRNDMIKKTNYLELLRMIVAFAWILLLGLMVTDLFP